MNEKTLKDVLIEMLEFSEKVHLGEEEHSSMIIEEHIKEVFEHEHARCPNCKKWMIKTHEEDPHHSYILTTMWWCACGYREFIGTEIVPRNKHERLVQAWKEINEID